MGKFLEWIEVSGGSREVARMLGTESPTVNAWIQGKATPKALMILQIVELTKGTVTAEDIIRDTKILPQQRQH